eukprot:CAMPEP_0117648088 /NCGR_PEP_ID=MMETSP0804-20121206/202_1 /TAXON_ID=1074897 /ORGANISM="Tetraselmis astigmatica, Strain CCMP880" /LENGTH=137 /DNA_ID=CAMNT_0005453635 /DNA_START=242 /DNA_END=652 /DNA_ORIENTATION=-
MHEGKDDVVAGEAELAQYGSNPPEERNVTQSLRGILVEAAATGIVRYSWKLLHPLIYDVMVQNLEELEKADQAECGPPKPLQTAESMDALKQNLLRAMGQFHEEPPYTLQRICEVVSEPQKQYKLLDKLAMAYEKLL